jgi:dTDP-4-dehydrorhamnose 3,5-epimerase
MTISETELPGVLIVDLPVYRDDRGHFFEVWHPSRRERPGLPLPEEFVQDNVSHSRRGVLRGLHYQEPAPQGKLVMPLQGEIYDVAVDIRVGSPTFGKWLGVTLAAGRGRQLYVPEGFAHGFAVTSEEAVVLYKCTRPYTPSAEGSVLWSDPDIGVAWPTAAPILSGKDQAARKLRDIPRDRLPVYDGDASR